jgi:hypothetical protein
MVARWNVLAVCGLVVSLGATFARADVEVALVLPTPLSPGIPRLDMELLPSTVVRSYPVNVPPNTTANQVASLFGTALLATPGIDPASVMTIGNTVHIVSTPLNDLLDDIQPGAIIYYPGTTAQNGISLLAPRIPHATIIDTGQFFPFTQTVPQQPAIFTAGIVTNVGTLSVNVTSAELNFQTDGPIICQALFQRLAPRAPQYGAQINYAGDRLEVYFDPAYTVTQGGIIFGTTSPSQGSSGTIYLPPIIIQPPPVGDYNLNGIDDAADYTIWRDTLGQVGEGLAADGNGDHIIDQLDYNLWALHFGESSGGAGALGGAAVPEPCSLALALFAVFGGGRLLRRWRRYQVAG